MEEFENGFDINVGSFLRMVLEPDSVWTSKTLGGYTLIVDKLVSAQKVDCKIEGTNDTLTQTVKNLIAYYNPPSLDLEYAGPIKYGATCIGCKRDFPHQKASASFKCWACENGY
jgi:hypothetical protein